MDLKKQIITESHVKFQFVVGSLVIRQLGSYCELSDVADGVTIPAGMYCTKMFWSIYEPWRIVQYTFSTFISKEDDNVYCGKDNNICIDHSESTAEVIQEKLDLIQQMFHSSELNNIASSDSDSDEDEDQLSQSRKDAVNSMLDAVTTSVDDDELRQNATDILPPEIKDVIFEDLPHDVLDGISMQDIFPKLMSYDDILNINENYNQMIKDQTDEMISMSGSDDSSQSSSKLQFPRTTLKRSKSDVLLTNPQQIIPTQKQRSCSLTWNCKLNTVKKRKISCESNLLILPNDDYNNDKIGEYLRRRILQVDGMNIASGSESEDESEGNPVWNFVPSEHVIEVADQPVRCQRCQCTYRTPDSYTRHLSNCETMSTSDSENEEHDHQTSIHNVYSNITITSTTTQLMPPPNPPHHIIQPQHIQQPIIQNQYLPSELIQLNNGCGNFPQNRITFTTTPIQESQQQPALLEIPIQQIMKPEPLIHHQPIIDNNSIAFQTTNPFASNYIEIQNNMLEPKYIIRSVDQASTDQFIQNFHTPQQNFITQQSTIIDNNIYSTIDPLKNTVILSSNQNDHHNNTRIVTPITLNNKMQPVPVMHQQFIQPNKLPKVRAKTAAVVRAPIKPKQNKINDQPTIQYIHNVQPVPQNTTVMLHQTAAGKLINY